MTPKELRAEKRKALAEHFWQLLKSSKYPTVKELVFYLNEKGDKTILGRPWTVGSVYALLSRELHMNFKKLRLNQKQYVLSLEEKIKNLEDGHETFEEDKTLGESNNT